MDERAGPSNRRSLPRVNYFHDDHPARADNGRGDEWDISEILDRRIVPTDQDPNGELEYHIRWQGCDPTDDLWVPLQNIRDMRIVQTFERRLEQEGPSFRPSNRGRDVWQPLSKLWKAKIRRLAQHRRQTDSDDDLTEEEECEIPPPPVVDVEVADDGGHADEEIAADEEEEEVEEAEEVDEEEEVDEVEEEEVEEEAIELGDSSDGESEYEDYALFANLSPPPPPPTPPRSPSPECLMAADSTEDPEPRSRPDSPDVSGYIPPLLRRREQPPIQAAPASPAVSATTPAEQTAGSVEQTALPSALPVVASAEPPSTPAEPADSAAVSTGQPEVVATPPQSPATLSPLPPNQPAVPADPAESSAASSEQPHVIAAPLPAPAEPSALSPNQPTVPAATPKNPPSKPTRREIVVVAIKGRDAALAGKSRNTLPVPGKRSADESVLIDLTENECNKKTCMNPNQPRSSASSDLQQSNCNPVAGSSAFSNLQQSSNNHVAHSSAFSGLQQSNNSSVGHSSASSDMQQSSHSMVAHSSAYNSNVDLALPNANNQLGIPLQPIPPPIPELPLPHVFQPNAPLPNFPLPANNAYAPFGMPPYLPFQLPLPVNNAVMQPAFPFQMQPPASQPMLAALAQALAFNFPPPMINEDGVPLVFNPFYRRPAPDGTRNSGTNVEQWSKKLNVME